MRAVEQSHGPIENWRIEVWERHSAKIGVRPAESVREYGLVIDLRDGVMPCAVPRARLPAQQYLKP